MLENPETQEVIETGGAYVNRVIGAGLGFAAGFLDRLVIGLGSVPGAENYAPDGVIPGASWKEDTNGSKPGTLGKADHQQTVQEEARKMGGKPEVKVETPGGEKGSRRIDAAKVENGKITEATQVIRPNKNGTAPAREIRAAGDIEKATGVKPKFVPVRPVDKPDKDDQY